MYNLLEGKTADIALIVNKPTSLIKALRELEALVEMTEIKRSVLQQLKYLIVTQRQKKLHPNSKFEGYVLHSVIYGPPGVGKTMVATILARIWNAIGLLRKPNMSPRLEHKDCDAKLSQCEVALKQNHTCFGLINNITMFIDADLHNSELQQTKLDGQCSTTTYSGKRKFVAETTRNSLNSVKRARIMVNDIKSISTVVPFPENTVEKTEDPDLPIVVVSREDFIGPYQGHSTMKTEALLKANLGRTLFIDEAYSLCHGDRDNFGMEVLTVLNRFMSEHAHEIIIIFAGYQNLLRETIFKAQPGLERRCQWVFDIPSYSSAGLAKIFQQQLQENKLSLDEKIDIVSFFRTHIDNFKAFGGDTKRLVFHCHLVHAERMFMNLNPTHVITEDILSSALTQYQKHQLASVSVMSESTRMMYG